MPGLRRALLGTAVVLAATLMTASADPLPPDATYRPLPTMPPDAVRALDEAMKAQVMAAQQAVLEQRYDLADHPMSGVMMSGGRKAVQGGVRVKLPAGQTWDSLGQMTPEQVRAQDLLPKGFLPLPHVKQATGGQVFPNDEIEELLRQEQRNLRRFDV